jgi:hypothetical protein
MGFSCEKFDLQAHREIRSLLKLWSQLEVAEQIAAVSKRLFYCLNGRFRPDLRAQEKI